MSSKDYEYEPGICDYCEEDTNGTHFSITLTGDRYPVEVCGDCLGQAIRDLAEADKLATDEMTGVPEVTQEVYAKALDKRDSREYDGPLTSI